MKKRLLSLGLCLCLLTGMIAPAYAEETEDGETGIDASAEIEAPAEDETAENDPPAEAPLEDETDEDDPPAEAPVEDVADENAPSTEIETSMENEADEDVPPPEMGISEALEDVADPEDPEDEIAVISNEDDIMAAAYLTEINSEQDLKNIAADSTAWAGDYKLMADIELSGEWTPIGTPDNPFAGTFDGNKFTISGNGITIGAIVEEKKATYQGLFGYVDVGGEVKNLTVSGFSVSGLEYVGGVVGYNAGTVTDCSFVDGTITTDWEIDSGYYVGGDYFGGVVGYNKGGTVEGCSFGGTMTSTSHEYRSFDYYAGGHYVGGVVGYNEGGTVQNSSGTSESGGNVLNANQYVGGIVGYNKDGTVTGYTFTGEVRRDGLNTQRRDVLDFGGVVGYNEGGTVTDCHNEGTLSKNSGYFDGIEADRGWNDMLNDHHFGGVVGYNKGGTVTNCSNANKMEIKGLYIGGIVGYNENGSVTGCNNTGKVSGTVGHLHAYSRWAGGVVGYNIGSRATVENCSNTGDVSSNGDRAGGVVGYNQGGSVTNCNNTGTVTTSCRTDTEELYTGGVVGHNQGGTVTKCSSSIGAVECSGGWGKYLGGVVGRNDNSGVVTDCYSTSYVYGGDYTGGVAGWNNGTVTNCYHTDNEVKGSSYTGGVAGDISGGTATSCYNTGAVTGDDYVGGVAGGISGGTVTNCYNTGNVKSTSSYNTSVSGGVAGIISSGMAANCHNYGGVSGNGSTGGVAGTNAVTVKNCYYHADVNSGLSGIAGAEDAAGVAEGRTTAQFESGEVAWLLQDGQESQTDLVWYQTLPGDMYPLLTIFYSGGGEPKAMLRAAFMEDTETLFTAVYANKGEAVKAPDGTPVRPGYEFKEWRLGGEKFESDVLNQNITVYAAWRVLFGQEETAGATITTTYGKAGTLDLDTLMAYADGSSAAGNFTYQFENGVDIVTGEYRATIAGSSLTVPSGVPAGSYTLTVIAREVSERVAAIAAANFGSGDVKLAISVIVEKADPTVTRPTAKENLFYNAADQELLIAGTSEHGAWQYKLGDGEYSGTVPTAKDAGPHEVYFKFVGDANHKDIAEESVTVTISGVAIDSVTLDKTALDLIVGGTAALTVTILPDEGTDKRVTWTSSDPAVATVSDSGLVTAVKEGAADITVTAIDGGKSAVCKVTVKEIPVSSVTLNKTVLVLAEGESETLAATVKPDIATDKRVTWTSSNTAVATVSGSGVVMAVGAGSASITATAGGKSAACTVTVTGPAAGIYKITFDPNGGSVTPTSDVTEEGGKLFSFPTPTRAGYTFDGWYTAAEGGTRVPINYEFTSNMTIYAHWTKVEAPKKTYTITFDANGGSVTPASAETEEGGKLFSFPTPTRAGYTFDGWYTDAEGGTRVPINYEFTSDMTIYAHWIRVSSGTSGSSSSGSGSSNSGSNTGGGSGSSNSGSNTGGGSDSSSGSNSSGNMQPTGSVSTTASTSGTTASASVKTSDMNKAIDSAAAEAARQGTVPVLEVDVQISSPASSLEVDLPISSLKKLDNVEDASLVITSDVATVALDNTALGALVDQATNGSTVTLQVTPVEASSLSSAQQEIVGNSPVVDLTMISHGTEIHNYNGGTITVTLPYELAPGQSASDIVVYYLESDGSLTPCKTSYSDGKVTFTTTHLSKYVIGEKEKGSVFTDVSADAYYAEAVAWAVENGITVGYDNGTFAPDSICSRANIMTFLWRAMGSPTPSSRTNPFVDADSGAYYYEAMLWAAENGITAGTGNGTTFDPNGTCTRAQIVTFLWRTNNKPAANTSSVFSDVAAGSYYTDAVAWAVENGITTGTGDGTTFTPDTGCTRGQCVTFLYRAR